MIDCLGSYFIRFNVLWNEFELFFFATELVQYCCSSTQRFIMSKMNIVIYHHGPN